MQLGAAGGGQFAILFFTFRGLTFGLGDGLHFEILDRVGHLADFIAAVQARQLNVEVPDREFAHRL